MTAANLNQLWARALVDELCRGGVAHAVVCPGSRSTPLALACADQPGLKTWSVIDERSAGFFALGIAKQSGRPVILVATSGTAPAHFYPAVIEAQLSHLTLVVLSADRPWELHGFGAPQTIDQEQLFGRHVRESVSLGLPEDVAVPHLRAVVARAIGRATSAPRGPLHFNVPFREPLAPTPDGVDPHRSCAPRSAVRRSVRSSGLPSEDALAAVREANRRCERGLIVCGPRDPDDGFGEAVLALSKATGYPVLAEATSQVRSAPGADAVVSRFDAILRSAAFAKAHRPERVLRFGGGITSKRLQAFLDESGAEIVAVSDQGALFDPMHRVSTVLSGDATAIARALSEGVVRAEPTAWQRAFEQAQQRAEKTLEAALAESEALSEPRLARELAAALPPGAQLFVSSSMPVRDVDGFAALTPGVRVLCNRGANGIDGVLASALGAAAASGRPTAVLIGDLAFLHDVGSLLIAHRSRIPLTVVVANNDGGGIFSFLPIAKFPEHFEPLFGTPHGMSFAKAAELYGATYSAPATLAELRQALGASLEAGLSVIEVRTDRAENVALHETLGKRIAAAVEEAR